VGGAAGASEVGGVAAWARASQERWQACRACGQRVVEVAIGDVGC